MRRIVSALGLAPFTFAAVVVAGAATAQKPARPIVFVADIQAAAPGIAQDASAVTMSLCGVLAKDPRVEVLCAPDVKQIMSFAAMGSLTGGSSPAVDALQNRLAAVTHVVSGTLAQKGDGFTLVLGAGTRSSSDEGGTPAFETPTVRLEERVQGKSARLLERLPELASRALKPLLAPAPSTTPTTPPEPLK